MKEVNKYKVLSSFSIRETVKKMDEVGGAFCVCTDRKDQVIGVVTDGDFRNAVHSGIQLDENITKIINRKFYYVEKGYAEKEIEDIFNNTIVKRIPVLNNNKLIDIVSLESFYGTGKHGQNQTMKSPAVIMAGGKGTRLDPFTRILPKPLIPLGDDPIIKVIMDEFNKFGMNDFFVSLNEKERMVRAYFHDREPDYHIKYIYEKKPLGTAGALKYLEGKVKEAFFVSNCDIIIRADYKAFYDFHKENKHALTMVGSMREYTIPYGVCETDNGGILRSIQEKPRYDFLVSTGMYLLEPELFKLIPKDEFFDMTDLISAVQERGLKVGIFPVSEKSWLDIGRLSEYKDIIKRLGLV